MKKTTITASRRQMMSAAGIGALATLLFTTNGRASASQALADAARDQIKALRKAKRRARRIKNPKARKLVVRNYNRALRLARQRLNQALKDS